MSHSSAGAGALAVFAVLALSACGKPAAEKAPPPDLSAVLDPAKGTGPWFICDALNAPTTVLAARPVASGEVNIVVRDKGGAKPAALTKYMLGAPQSAAGATTRTLSKDGAAVGYVKTLDPASVPDPAGITTPPVVEVKLGEATLNCRWLARTRLVGLTTKRTVVVTEEKDGPVYRTFEFSDAAKAQPVTPDAAQRSTTPSLEIRNGKPFGDDYGFGEGPTSYSVGEGGVTTLNNRYVVAGEPFVAVQVWQRKP
jgi:hypothetical protein